MANELKAAAQKELLRRRAMKELERRRAAKAAPSAGEDMLRSGAAGLVKGAAAIPGGFADAANMTGDALSWAAQKMGAPEWAQNAAQTAGRYSLGPLGMGPTTEQITSGIANSTRPAQGLSGLVTGEKPQSFIEYQPKTMQGEYAETLGEFAPAAVGGPGGLLRKAASATGAALASETAGQLTKGKAAEPYARLGGALLGGGALGIKNAKKGLLEKAPSEASVAQAKNTAYRALENAGIKYDADGYGQFASELANKLQQDGLDPILHPLSSRALQRVVAEIGDSPTFTKMETLRKIAGDVLNSKDAAERRMASVIMRELDNFSENSALISNGSVPAGQVKALADRARELARRSIITRDLKEMDRKSGWYVSGEESGMRNQLASYGRGPKGKRLTPEEKEAFQKAMRREGVQGLLTTAGGRLNLAVSPSVGAGLGMGLVPFIGPFGPLLGAAAATGAHLGARKIMEGVTNRAVDRAKKTVLLGKQGQKKLPKRGLVPSVSYARGGLLANQSQARE